MKQSYAAKQKRDVDGAQDTHDQMGRIGDALFLQSNVINKNYKINSNYFHRGLMENSMNY